MSCCDDMKPMPSRVVASPEILRERRRIAADLHDRVIQKLFCAAMTLDSVANRAGGSETGPTMRRVVADINGAIGEVRAVIHQLRSPPTAELRLSVLRTVEEARSALGFEPAVTFSGPVDGSVAGMTAEHLTSTLREALLNVARHADASAATVQVTVRSDLVVLDVADNGIGYSGPRQGGLGVHDMQDRADQLGGSFCIESSQAGTRLRWTAPLDLPAAQPDRKSADESLRDRTERRRPQLDSVVSSRVQPAEVDAQERQT
ncbi:MAG: hypothetical protein JJLCMIEE_01285 [Acidimicrobiales bacterium]|nr:MAG: hypothetical protein EDR02_07000 [Actinomycetota bacterium]MBV6508225.1 hypothetical protein [Acidimicrobiales bacterium]RIK07298.1 MAG: hypothetical protein DCC48_04250 [Acidobacteriota bacterium]